MYDWSPGDESIGDESIGDESIGDKSMGDESYNNVMLQPSNAPVIYVTTGWQDGIKSILLRISDSFFVWVALLSEYHSESG